MEALPPKREASAEIFIDKFYRLSPINYGEPRAALKIQLLLSVQSGYPQSRNVNAMIGLWIIARGKATYPPRFHPWRSGGDRRHSFSAGMHGP